MLEIRDVYSGYDGKTVLHGVSLRAAAGQITMILGPNGCGKSTLLKTICGIQSVTSGQILLDGENLLALSSRQAAQKAAYLAQNRQIPDITVGRLVLHGRFPYLSYPRRYREADYLAAEKVMEQMRIRELARQPLSCLSGGQRQKAYIAMALAQDTDIILLDEPTTYLDVSCQLQMLRQARELADSGKYVIMVLHDLPHALAAADRILLMREGSAVMEGTPGEVFDAGVLEEVFGVRVARVQAGGQWHYFCMEKDWDDPDESR